MQVALTGAAGIAGLLYYFRERDACPQLVCKPGSPMERALARCPAFHVPYECTPYLRNGILSTVFTAVMRQSPDVEYRRELVQTGACCADVSEESLWDRVCCVSRVCQC